MAMLRTTTPLLLTLVAGFALACFDAPSDDVLFSCLPMEDEHCPTGYSCEADGCCHKDGSDVQASWGACGLGGSETGTATDTGTDTTGTETSTETGSETGTETTDTGSETGTETTDTGTSDTTSG